MSDAVRLVLLSIVNWLHLAATVTWLGAMVTNMLVLMPAARETLEPQVMGRFMGSFMKKFRPLVYLSIIALVVTGVIMMLLNRHYLGILDFGNLWTWLLLVKHIIIIIMVVMVIYAFETLAPKVGKLAAAGPSPELAKLQKLQMNIAMAGLLMALSVLLLTSVITAISSLP
ncbi:MAG: hypothetical protein Q7R50_06545 [Dehalococcoidales bacterium]|nr:hypothetical protein [Dehalococcoidales bacterium]